jgi:hypothetical protein
VQYLNLNEVETWRKSGCHSHSCALGCDHHQTCTPPQLPYPATVKHAMQNRVQNKLPYGDGCFQFISFQRDFVCERKNSLISAQNRVSTRKGWCKNYLLPGFVHISNPCCQLRSDRLSHCYVLPPWRIPVSRAIETDSAHLWTQYKHDAQVLGSGSLPVACTADCGHKVSHTPASSHMLHWRGPLRQGEIHWRLSSHWFQASIL